MLRRFKPISIAGLLLISTFVFIQFPSAWASPGVTQKVNTICGPAATSCQTGSFTATTVGEVLVVTVATGPAASNQGPYSGTTASTTLSSITFAKQVAFTDCYALCGGTGNYIDTEIWTGTIGAMSTGTVTFTFNQNSGNTAISVIEVSQISATASCSSTGGSGTGSATSGNTGASCTNDANSLAVGAPGSANCVAATGGAGYTTYPATARCGTMIYGTFAGTTNFPFTLAGGGSAWIDAGIVFGHPVRPGIGTCSILNPDAGNYLLPNGKYYDFHCVVNSQWIGTYAPILGVRITFNDSVHTMILSYSNNTAVSYGVGFSVLNGSSTVTLSPSSTAVGVFDPVTGNRTFTIDYLASFNAATLVDSVNRGIYLFAFTDLLHTRGPVYLGNSFNFLNKGGGVDTKSHGKCGVYPGSDTFQDYCYFGSDSHNWIAENATYYQLQQYQAQFFLETDNQTSAGPTFTANSPQTGYFWQPFSESGAGTNPSSNKGDFQLRMGLYHYDNTTWVKGLNVLIQMGDGRVGSSNLWTHLVIQWYNGPTTLIANQSIYVFVPQINLSQVGIWVNLWYSQNNMSTTQGGMVGSYYTGMHKTGFLIFTTWSPFLQNQTESQVFAPLLDHTGKVMSTQLAQFTKVYENLTRPGAPLVHAKQFNFQIQTTNFKEQEFNTASAGMGGIVTPTFAGAIVPVISSPSVFSPIINAIKAIATYISKALVALGQVVWAALAHQFPWFTQFWTFVGVTVLSFITILGQISIGLYQVLIFIVNNIANVVGVPFNILGTTYTNILSLLFAFTHYLPANEIVPLIQLFIIITFGLSVFEALATGDWPFIIRFTKNVWNVTNSVFTWTWALVKVMIDTIEGLIP